MNAWTRFSRRVLKPLPLLTLSSLALLETPLRSSFTVRARAVCEYRASWAVWASGAANLQHLLSYGILTILAAFTFRQRPLRSAAMFVLGLSAAVELQQAIFTVGHCRLRDMLPNLLAVALATCASATWQRKRGIANATSDGYEP
jgi:hypothetical protein